MTEVSRSKNSCCCTDCYEPHKEYGCGGCVPQWLCAVIVLDPPPSELGCCRVMHGKMPHVCNTDDYLSVNLACGPDISLTVGASIAESLNAYGETECCFRVVLTSPVDEIVFTLCGASFSTDLSESFSIAVSHGPTVTITGNLEISKMTGVSNSGQWGNLELGTEPPCNPIKLFPRRNPPDDPVEPCNRPFITEAVKVAAEFLNLNDPDLFDNELCWLLAPCKCIPLELCLRYIYMDKCENIKIVQLPLPLSSCQYGPLTFSITRGGYPGGNDVITITGELTDSCEVKWTIKSSLLGTDIITKSLTRVPINDDIDAALTKRCDPTISSDQILDGDSIFITDECRCDKIADQFCPYACSDLTMPTIAVGEPPNTDVELYCDHSVLTGTIVGSCGPIEGFTFEMWPFGAEVPLPNFPLVALVPSISTCQSYSAYDTGTRNHEIFLPDCGLDPGEPVDSERKVGYFTLYYPNECPEDPDAVIAADPSRYLLDWFIHNECGFSNKDESGTALSPSSASCDPFELVFDITFPDLPNCECPCSSIQLKITL